MAISPPPSESPTALWVTAAQVTAGCADDVTGCVGCDPSLTAVSPVALWTSDQLAAAASEILFYASGSRFPGLAVETVWPSAVPWQCAEPTDYTVLELDTQWPVVEITEVKIDGAVVDPATYRLDDWGRIQRLTTPGVVNPGWPVVRWPDRAHPVVPTPGAGTFSVSYRYGRVVPLNGMIAALALACAMRAWSTPVAELFGDNVTSLSTGGMSMSLETTAAAVADGRTGINAVDRFLCQYGQATRPVGIWTPGLEASRHVRRQG